VLPVEVAVDGQVLYRSPSARRLTYSESCPQNERLPPKEMRWRAASGLAFNINGVFCLPFDEEFLILWNCGWGHRLELFTHG
jgi:hypothetical protein